MSSHSVNTAIFDIGMVLLRFDFNCTIQKLKDRCMVKPEQMQAHFFGSGLVDSYDRGMISSEEFAQKGSELLGFQGTTKEFLDSWSDIFTPNLPMIERAKRWKQRGMPLYLLSNTCEAHIEFFLAKYDVFQIFEGAVYSCRERAAKPEPMIYETILKRYDLDAQKTMFIDDRLENIIAAKAFKIHGLHYEDEPRLLEALRPYKLD